MPKTILPPKQGSELFFDDNIWAKLRGYIPKPLQPEDEARLREGITAACSWLLAEQARLALGIRTVAASKKRGKGQPALLELFIRHLRAAATIWEEIKESRSAPYRPCRIPDLVWEVLKNLKCERENGMPLSVQIRKLENEMQVRERAYNIQVKNGQMVRRHADHHIASMHQVIDILREMSAAPAALGRDVTHANRLSDIHDDRLSDIRQYDALEAMARDAERRLAGIRKLGEAEYDDPFPIFVRKVVQCFLEIGLRPTAKGRVYDEKGGKPTWFQEFMLALNNNLLGIRRLIVIDSKGKQFERDPRAFYAEIAKAMSGYKKPGKARKQITAS
jgi:hypothetical protein